MKKKTKQHILHIISSLQQGGAETLLLHLIKQMPELNHTVIYFHDGPLRTSIEKLGIPTYQAQGLLKRYDPWFFWRLIKLVKKINPNQILSSLWAANFFGRIIAKLYDIPITCILHTVAEHENRLRNIIDFLLPIQPTRYVAVSKSVAQSFNNKKTLVIPNGVPEVIGTRNTSNSFIFGTVGRLVPVKNYNILIKAFAQLHKIFPTTQLIIIGSGPEEKKLKRLVVQYNLTKHIKLLGTKNARDYYHTFDCFVQPSQFEGLSLALLEALSAKLPVIVTGTSQHHDVIQHNHNGLVSEPNHQQKLYYALKKIMLKPQLRNLLAKNGYKTFKDSYTIKITAQRYKKILLFANCLQ